MFLIWIIALSLLFATAARATDFPVANEGELDAAISIAKPGDKLVLSNGEWRDAQIVFVGQATKSAPITLRAKTPGKVVFTGTSTLKIGGEHLVVEGLLFDDPDPTVSDVIQFRKDSKQIAKNCRMTNCAMRSNREVDSSRENRWIGLYGESNRVDNSTFEGKSSKGTTFVVWLGDNNVGRHRIDHNYFGPREKLGKNGGETIRIGDSKTSMLRGDCVIESNLFEKCNGEVECISNKSCGNVYRDNTFLQVSGTLTLRHGNRCLVERNCFLGDGANGTGGIRVIGEDHIVRGNYLAGLTGDDARSAITLMMGIPNSPAERYFQVQRAKIENNTLVDCEHSILIGLSDDKNASLAPIDSEFSGNRIISPEHAIIEARCDTSGIAWNDNKVVGKTLGLKDTPAGITMLRPGESDDIEISSLTPISRESVGADWAR